MFLTILRNKMKSFIELVKQETQRNNYIPIYRLVEIIKSEQGEYKVVIQIISKNLTFTTKPEELLADDEIVDQFSPRDIRTLTYLGYLGINCPKYKILAQRLSTDTDKMVFAIKKKGDKNIIVKTADQIICEEEIIGGMTPTDAKTVGFVMASEGFQEEKKQKEAILHNLKV